MGFPSADPNLTSNITDGLVTLNSSIKIFPHCDGPLSTGEDDVDDKTMLDEFGNLDLFPFLLRGGVR